MPRKKNDGRGRLGGRQAGTPNKDNPLKTMLHEHSVGSFTPSIDANTLDFLKDENGQTYPEYRDSTLSRFDVDCLQMKATDRAKVELEILQYHTPKLQSITAEMGVTDRTLTFSQKFSLIANGKELPPSET